MRCFEKPGGEKTGVKELRVQGYGFEGQAPLLEKGVWWDLIILYIVKST